MKLSNLFVIIPLYLFYSSLHSQPLEIWEIQGNQLASPYLGQEVTTTNNVITAIVANGFFMQSSTENEDDDPTTSNGIKVTTGNRPAGFAPGQLISVTGVVSENNGMTQLTGDLSFDIPGGVLMLPPPTMLNTSFPTKIIQEVPDLESTEGMMVSFQAMVNSPSNWENIVSLSADGQRLFREPGIPYPGIPGLPIWDANPEMFWMDPDGIDQMNNRFLGAGMTVEATAIMTHQQNRYITLPITYRISGSANVRSVRLKNQDEFTVGSLNLLQLRLGTTEFDLKITKLLRYINEVMRFPDILAVQEVGNRQSLEELAQQINDQTDQITYTPYYTPGNDGIHVAFLVNSQFEQVVLTQFQNNEELTFGGILHDRPPLMLTITVDGGLELSIINLHMRSRTDIDNPERANFVRRKRFEQSVAIAQLVQDHQDKNLLIIGDYNAFEFTDGYVDVVNQIQGMNTLGAEYNIQPIVDPPLTNLTALLPPTERYSFIFQGYSEMIDHCLANEFRGLSIEEVQFARGNADNSEAYANNPNIPHRSSDHDGIVVYVKPDPTTHIQNKSESSPLPMITPNPVRVGQSFHVMLPNNEAERLMIYHGNGQLAQQQRIQGAQSLDIQLSPFMIPGVYWVVIQQKSTYHTFRILVLH